MMVALMITATSDVTPLGKIHIATVEVKPDGSAWSHTDKVFSRFVLDPPPSSDESPWVLIARAAAAAARAEESQ
jgi:hypothetical protein